MFVNRLPRLYLTSFLWLVAAPLSQASAQALSESESKSLIDSVVLMGEGYRSEIATAKIDYQYAYLGFAELKLSPEETRERLKTLDFSQLDSLMPKAMKAFEEKMHLQNLSVRERWVDKQLVVRGKDFVSKDPFHDQLLQGDVHLVFDHGNKHVKCFNPGQSMLMTEDLNSFRLNPDPRMFEGVTLHKAADYETSHLIEVHFNSTPENPATVGSINPDDGFLRRQIVATSPGEPFKELYFEQYTTFPGGVLLPLLKVEIDYRDKILKSIQFTIIKNAVLNGEIADSEFVRSMKKGDSWFDKRENTLDSGMFRQDVSDVCEFFRARKNSPGVEIAEEVKAPESNLTSWIFFANGLILLVIGVFLWRRT